MVANAFNTSLPDCTVACVLCNTFDIFSNLFLMCHWLLSGFDCLLFWQCDSVLLSFDFLCTLLAVVYSFVHCDCCCFVSVLGLLISLSVWGTQSW